MIHEDEDDSLCTSTTSHDVPEDLCGHDDDDTCSTCSSSTLDSAFTMTSGDRVTLRRDVYSCSNMDHRMREFHEGNEIKDFETAQTIVRQCSVVVGMHPDQAAEHLLDFALQNRKPFVLVPCCVYHKQFPHR